MKILFKFATLSLTMFAVSVPGFAMPKNLERGIVGPVGSNNDWNNCSIGLRDSKRRTKLMN
jgi:hypothetical protein